MHRPKAFTRDAKRRLRRFLPLAVIPVLAAVASCTPEDIARWQEWHASDPEAAVEFANRPEVQEALQRRSATTQQAAPQAARSSSGGGTVWDRLAQCESGGNWGINTGNGYYGGLQFLPSTWRANGGSGMPHQHSREEQIRVAENLRANSGFAPWPACSSKLGLR